MPPQNMINAHMMNVSLLSIRFRLEELEEEKSLMMVTTQQMTSRTALLERQLEESKEALEVSREALAQLKAEEETERIQRKEVIIEILSVHLR